MTDSERLQAAVEAERAAQTALADARRAQADALRTLSAELYTDTDR